MYQGDHYLRYRPAYPELLADRLFDLCETGNLAWDCCTGNGQLALLLARKFRLVIASDISFSQLAYAKRRVNIQFRRENVLESQLPEGSLDLVTIAQALHWLNREKFYRLVSARLKPGGLLAILNYRFCSDPRIAAIARFFIDRISNPKTLQMLETIERGYAGDTPEGLKYQNSEEIEIGNRWDIPAFLGYLETISVTNNLDPEAYRKLLDQCREMAVAIWADPLDVLEVKRKLRIELFKKPLNHV